MTGHVQRLGMTKFVSDCLAALVWVSGAGTALLAALFTVPGVVVPELLTREDMDSAMVRASFKYRMDALDSYLSRRNAEMQRLEEKVAKLRQERKHNDY